MRSIHSTALSRIITLIGFVVLLVLPSPASADSFVVNSTDDVDDGICDSNHCSLREAINAANSNPGADTISFAGLYATSGDVTIQLNSFLNPLLDNGTTIDGTTAIGYVNEPVVNIVKAAGVIDTGIAIQGSNCIVRGLSMAGFGTFSGGPDPQPGDNTGGAIVISGPANLIESNVLGWGAWANSNGVWLASAGNSVIGNVISGNVVGVYITGPNQIIQGNQIGTDASGTVAIPNTYGIYDDQSSGGGHVIGGVGAANRNVVSGNNKRGIYLRSDNNTIQGNYVGTNSSGTAGLGNGNAGIYIWSDNNLIGGPGAGNQVSGNGSHGMVVLSDHANANNVVQGNKIGTDISGTSPIPNLGVGIYTTEGGGMTYGGIGVGKGNIIAFNLYSGIDAEGPNQKILGNEIFSNGDYGIADGTLFSRNSIYDNDNLGIASRPSIPEPPVLVGSVGSTISGTTCNHCLVEVFLAEPDPTGAGEGKEYLGSVVASNIGDFSMTLPPGLPFCANITTTRTDSYQLTSSFSHNVNVNCIKFGPYFLIPIWTFIIAVFGVFGVLIHRRRPDGSRWIIPGSLAVGALVGGGLILLAGTLPNVIVDFTPEQPVPYSGLVSTCDSYLDPAGASPQDGALLELTGDIPLMWTPADNVPEGTLRWGVELVEVGVDAGIQTTQQNSVPISSFGMTPGAGSSYEWSLLGQRLLQDGETWLTFCAPDEPWVFSIEEEISEVPETEEEEISEVPETEEEEIEEPVCISPLITALMNMTCRKGPDQAYEEAGYLLQGETAIPEGVSMDTFWYWIPNPDWLGYCFVAGNGVQAECVDGLPPIAAPPLPTATPTQTACIPTLDHSACNDAGGIWEADTGTCICP